MKILLLMILFCFFNSTVLANTITVELIDQKTFKEKYADICYENMIDNQPDEACLCMSESIEQLVTNAADQDDFIKAVRLSRNFNPISDELFNKVGKYFQGHKKLQWFCVKQSYINRGYDYPFEEPYY